MKPLLMNEFRVGARILNKGRAFDSPHGGYYYDGSVE